MEVSSGTFESLLEELGGGFRMILPHKTMLFGHLFCGIFTSNIGEDESQFDEHIFQMD